jgi:uncharacterized protein
MNPLQAILILMVRVYRVTLCPAKSFLFGPFAHCRFTPSCSKYALEAIRTHGAAGGSWLAAKRICRCHPWGECGHDPVPPQKGGMRNAGGGPNVSLPAEPVGTCR